MSFKIPYNTEAERLRLPEYGRTIQSLIDYCVTIPDREERTQCAYAIAGVMSNMFPDMKGDNNNIRKIWDQMVIMSEFRLDVDFPYEVITEEKLNPKPARIPYSNSHIARRHYGHFVESMIPLIADMPDGPEKEDLIAEIANHMKKLMLLNNKEGVDDSLILRDLEMYSGGKIRLTPEDYRLMDFVEASATTKNTHNNKKKRKK